jgi:undecaprenyl-diphosphatase
MRRTLATALALIVLLATSIVAASGEISDLETDAFHWVNDLPDAWEPVMYVFQLGGLVGLPAVVAIGAALSRRWRLAATLVALIPLKLLIEKAVIKQLIERERPGASVCAFDRSCGHFRGDVSLDGLSYISGHAVIAWGMAALLWPYLAPRWRWLPVTVAALNSVARVYLGAHVPLDVIGGAATGVALGCLLTMLAGTERRSPASELVDHGDDARGG